MTLPITLSPQAQAEFDEAVDWYEKHAGLGKDILARVRALQRIGICRVGTARR